ncbi:hypothetical protein SAMN05443574_10725 [Haloarcula vallismortis]|uniref:Uncharacterized protein n=1 Tax=Haloarcula vallismortis TaxID=28442 RepID=A0A1H2WIR1_HALVA|nr:hypothetical protein SAMN05443574_10725 [Haloarcula vallismortis]
MKMSLFHTLCGENHACEGYETETAPQVELLCL